ncbi:hypothetical protein [Ramlibacter sp. AN1133]|uniref:hypothetical protein n=1 Tax=Ramlibacter sp. AN1133 TaxID=3133429 RepID=UPI0030C3B6A8
MNGTEPALDFAGLRSRLEDAYAAIMERCERSDTAAAWAERTDGAAPTSCEAVLQQMADVMGDMDAVKEPTDEDSVRFASRVVELAGQADRVALP